MTAKQKEIPFAVFIPVKDRVHELRQTLTSIYVQTVLPKEIVIIDDCSDIPLQMSHIPTPPDGVKVTIIRNDINLGAPISLNRAVSAVSYPYIAILDSDDCYLPDAMEKFTSAWQNASSDVACIIGGFFWCTYDLTPYRVQIGPPSISRLSLLTRGNNAGGSSVFTFRRDAYMEVGGHPEIRGNYDWGLLLRLSLVGKINILQTPVVLYRSPSTNLLPTYTKSYRKLVLAYYKLYRLQNADDRKILKPLIRSAMLKHMACLNRPRLFSVVFRSMIAHGQNPFESSRPFLIWLLGIQRVDKILYVYACARARWMGKKLLSRYGYAPDTAERLMRAE